MSTLAWLRAGLLSLCLAWGVQHDAVAQAGSATPADRAAYDAAFKAMIADPGNLDKAFAFAELAVKVGDLEGAVSALERMLIITPNLPRVKLELGVLYYRLGTYQVARRHVSDVLAAPNVPEPVRQRAQTLLGQIDRELATSKFSGTVLFGFRYQSNATAAPTGGNVRFGGIDAQLDRQFTSARDVNSFLIGTMQHIYDFGTQAGDVLDTQAVLYIARQFKQTQVDLFYGSLSTGPRMWLLPSTFEKLSIRPYAALDYVHLGTATEYVAPGAGVNLDRRWSDAAIGFVSEIRRRDYHNSGDRPFNDFRTGWEVFGRLSGEWQALPWLLLGATGGAGRFDARQRFESYYEYLLGVGAQLSVPGPSWAPGEPFSLALSVARVWSNYWAPDQTIDPNVRRRDREWRLSLTAQIPVSEGMAVVLQGARNSRSSSLPNFDYTNYIAMGGITWRF